MKKGNVPNKKEYKNEFIGMDKQGLSRYKENAQMNIETSNKAIARIKERAKEEIRTYKNEIEKLESVIAKIEEAEQFLENNKVEYQTIIVVRNKNIYRRKEGTRPMYVGDISGLLTYKGYSFSVIATNDINNPMDTKTLYNSNDFLMDEKAILRDKMLEKIEEFKVKKIYLTRDVSIGTKVYENMGIIVEKRDYI